MSAPSTGSSQPPHRRAAGPEVARMLAIVEAITGLLYVGVFISRLVGIYSSAQPAAAADVADQA